MLFSAVGTQSHQPSGWEAESEEEREWERRNIGILSFRRDKSKSAEVTGLGPVFSGRPHAGFLCLPVRSCLGPTASPGQTRFYTTLPPPEPCQKEAP